MKLVNMTKTASELYRQGLLQKANTLGVKIVHVFDQSYPKGGLTIAFRKTVPEHTSTNMVEVAVATCSRLDTFNRKLGTTMALGSFFDGAIIELPLSFGYADEDLNKVVKEVFSTIYFGKKYFSK